MSNGERPPDRVLQEFISEAHENVENLNRDLLALDARKGGSSPDHEVLNNAFRSVHTLKGLSGLFGVASMSAMSHTLESLLDALRLGRVQLSPEILDLLFEAVEVYGQIIAATSQGRSAEVDAAIALLPKIERAAAAIPRPAPAPLPGFAFDPALLSVLTEYEEHRLRESLRLGRTLYRLHTSFDVATIDRGLEELKARLKPVGEVITYLPSADAAVEDRIELDVIIASDRGREVVAAAATSVGAQVTSVVRPPELGGDDAGTGDTPGDLGEETIEPSREAEAPALQPAASTLPVPPVEPAPAATLRSVTQTVRVDIRKLDHLMNVVGELALVRAGVLSVVEELRADRATAEVGRRLQHEARVLERKLNELQAGILEVRMVPLGQIFDKLSRVVRRISREAGKEIRLSITGAETELDKLIVEELSDPLMHIIRNAIDHGIEPGEERRRWGKSEIGSIGIHAQQRGNHVIIDVTDDGAGFDEDRILETALQRGLVDRGAASELSRRELLNLVFLPGFSTRDEATELSGRGVGMDVVKTNIAKLSGIIDLSSTRGGGTSISITLPITLAILHALIIRAAGRTFAVPLNSVLESLTLEPAQVRTIEGRQMLTVRGQTLFLARVDAVLGLPRAEPPGGRGFVVVVGVAQHRIGFIVDELVGQQDVVLKSLGPALGGVPGIAGATELGGQQIVLVLDVAALVEEVTRGSVEAA